MTNAIITAAQLDAIASILDEDGDDVWRVDYSGRGMYGRECVGYTGGYPTQAAILLALAATDQLDAEVSAYELMDALHEIGEVETDSMGRGSISYWRGVTVTTD